MVAKNILSAGLLALSVGCVDNGVEEEQQRLLKERQSLLKERQNKLGELCEATHNATVVVAKAIHSEAMMGLLNSKEWCKVQDRYESDQRDLTIIANEGAMVYCMVLRSEADRLAAANEKPLTRINFQNLVSCEGGYYDVLRRAFDLQKIIHSYLK